MHNSMLDSVLTIQHFPNIFSKCWTMDGYHTSRDRKNGYEPTETGYESSEHCESFVSIGSVIIYGRFSLHQMFQFDSGFSMTNGRVILSCLGKVSYENTKLYKRKENKPYSLPFLTFFTCFGVARRL